jgi:Ca2+/Na+ antiporter
MKNFDMLSGLILAIATLLVIFTDGALEIIGYLLIGYCLCYSYEKISKKNNEAENENE